MGRLAVQNETAPIVGSVALLSNVMGSSDSVLSRSFQTRSVTDCTSFWQVRNLRVTLPWPVVTGPPGLRYSVRKELWPSPT